MRQHQNALRTLVYMIECIVYVLLCAQKNAVSTVVYTTCQSNVLDEHRMNICEPKCRQNVSSYKQIKVASFMSPMSPSNYQNNRKIHLTLCNSFALSRIELIFGMEVLWDNRHQHIPRCFSNPVAMATKV